MNDRRRAMAAYREERAIRKEGERVLQITIVAAIIFVLAIIMTMTGRGGGNFYVLTLALAGIPMHEAATTGQFVLFTTALAATLIFHKHKALSWPLAVFIGVITAGMAFFGGFLAHHFSGVQLKLVYSLLLVVAGIMMLFPFRQRDGKPDGRIGYWNLKAGEELYIINLWLVVPVAAATGFFAGMVGVSGGSFLVPLMVLACGLPMHIAVGTATVMVASTAFAGFMGHALHGSFNPVWAIPIAAATIVGGTLGGRIALKTKPAYLKTLFAVTTLAAAVVMIVNAAVAKP